MKRLTVKGFKKVAQNGDKVVFKSKANRRHFISVELNAGNTVTKNGSMINLHTLTASNFTTKTKALQEIQ